MAAVSHNPRVQLDYFVTLFKCRQVVLIIFNEIMRAKLFYVASETTFLKLYKFNKGL